MRTWSLIAVGVFCLLSAFGTRSALGLTVYADTYGWNATDATAALQAAINSGADTVILKDMGSPWFITPITLASNQHIIFQTGVLVEAKPGAFTSDGMCLFTASSKTNITLDGYGATLQMQKAEYTSGEHRHGVKVMSCSNITIEGLTIKDTGGDGIYLGTAGGGAATYNSNITVKDVISDNNRRQGMSIISVDGLTVDHCSFTNTTGTAPAAGMDFEPNGKTQRLTNINVSNTTISGNDGWGVLVYAYYFDNTTTPISMTFTNCSVGTDGFGVYDRSTGDPVRGAAAPTGLITLTNFIGTDTEQSNISIVVVKTQTQTVSFAAATSSGLESAGTVSLAVQLSATSTNTITVDYSVTGGTATGGGVDYTLAGGTLTFLPGETAKNIPMTIVNDTRDEPDETVVVTLSNPVNVTMGSVATHTYTIQDDDNPPTVAFATTASSGPETVATANMVVQLSAASGKTITVAYAVTGGTATGGGVDYTLAPGTLTFFPGETTKNITIAVVNDARSEADETVVVALSSPTNAALGAAAVHTHTIVDSTTPPTVSFVVAASSGPESVAAVNLAVRLSASSAKTITVAYAATGGTATGGGVDYTLAPGTLTFLPGETSKNIAMTVVNDTIDEPDETVVVTLKNPVNVTLGTIPAYTYTILDSTSAPTVSFAAATSSGSESVAAVNLAVRLSAASGKTITVAYAATGGTATGGGVDYTLSPGTLTFLPGETAKNIPMAVVDDPLCELNETVVVSLSSPTNATLGTIAATTYTIVDNDGFAVKINFQQSWTAVPSGYWRDSGDLFGNRGNGCRYGWTTLNKQNVWKRFSNLSPDERYDTVIAMQRQGSRVWELEVPNGTYEVQIVAGDAASKTDIYRINVEGTLGVNGQQTAASRWVTGVCTVVVADGRLTVSNAAGARDNKMCFIQVVRQPD